MKTKVYSLSITMLVMSINVQVSNAQPYCDEAQVTSGFPGFSECELAVCSQDAFCCTNIWDLACAMSASETPECAGCLAGADHTVVSGIAFLDYDCNGIFDGDDILLSETEIFRADSLLVGTTNENGEFEVSVPPGAEHTITLGNIPGALSMPQETIIAPLTPVVYSGIELGVCPDSEYFDVSGYFYPNTDNPSHNFVPGDILTYFIHISNHSFVPVNAELTYTFDPAGLNVTEFDGGQLNGNVVSWQVVDLAPLSSDYFVINLIVTQDAEIGEVYLVSANAILDGSFPDDVNPGNNEQILTINIGAPPPDPEGFCDQMQVSAGFPDFPACESVVCSSDPFCCDTQWDMLCANLAADAPECEPCAFGASYSTISGTVFVDYNCNGVMDGNDFGLSDHGIESSVGGVVATSTGDGSFSGYIQHTNLHHISPSTLPGFTLPNPVSITTPDTSIVFSGVDLGMCPVADYQDVGADISINGTSGGSLYATEEFVLDVCADNLGPWDSDGLLTLTYDESLFVIVDADGGTVNNGEITWNVALSAMESFCFQVEAVVSAGVAAGTASEILLNFEMNELLPDDQNLSNNNSEVSININLPTAWGNYCDQPQPGPGFPADPGCEEAICAMDAFCCFNSWDVICASSAANEPECYFCLFSTNATTVSGLVYMDFECDGTMNNDDVVVPNTPIFRDDQLMAQSNVIGEYSGLIELNQNVELTLDALTGFTYNSHTVFSEEVETITGLDFAICPSGSIVNLAVTVSPVGLPPRPGFPVEYKVCVNNYSTEQTDAELTFNFSNMLDVQVIDADGGSVVGSEIVWLINNIGIFEATCFNVTFQVIQGTPPGILLTPEVSIDVLPDPADDIDFSNNEHSFSHEVVAAFDPNDKTVDQPLVNFTEVEEGEGVQLQYVIRFQNSGNFFATNVRVEDELPELLDINTIETLHASHDYELMVHPDNTVEWVFNDIMLPDSTSDEPGSHGQIHFRISTVPDVQLEDVIENSASIFFDFKEPVITEPAITTFMDCSEGSLSIQALENLCVGEEFSLTSNRDDFENYNWSINGSNYEGEEIDLTLFESGTVVINLTATNPVCTLSTDVELEVFEQPYMNMILDPWVGCHAEVEIDVDPNGEATWYLDGDLMASGNPVTLYDSGLYLVAVENECGMIENNVAVEVYDMPDEVTMTFDGEQLVVSPEGSSYMWFLDGMPLSQDGPAITPTEAGDYSVIVYFGAAECNLTSNTLFVSVSIQESLAAQVELFPNPARDISTLMLPQGQWQVSLVDASGKTVRGFENVTTSQLELDLSNLARGVYFVHVQSDDGAVVKKLVVE